MPLMAAPKRKPKAGKDTRPNGMFCRPSDAMRAALAAYIAAQDVPPRPGGVLVKALEEFLERRGFWPPKA